MTKTPPPRKPGSFKVNPLAADLAAKSLMAVGKKDGDLSAQLAALKLKNKYGTKRDR